ncbi:hypothetical protein GCM10009122_00210 [Fulvivirga kasyanovii]|uniref:DUF4440 domain-containing protein n=1 Tax=Fulvivirga kasyanovii TaxID=396812 RepID=A0ABW9RPP6_9BACT|nr:hypothetical protein [Fulvivirga kasyanovii]MTI25963.1 hypothetical protein [Fulvivirga kasyanovii]
MKVFNRFTALALISIGAISCQPNGSADEQVLIDTDLAFADMAEQQGVGAAFIAYADSNAIIMQNGRFPLKGISEITTVYANTPTDLSLVWQPEKAEISGSGDLGYTFGQYTFSNQNTTEKGHYVTIWKKDKQDNGSMY